MESENTKASRRTMSEAIFDLVEDFGIHPWYINDGSCEDFANQIAETIEGAEPTWGDEEPHLFGTGHGPEGHCYIFYDGGYYDAEEPFGVTSPARLPFFHRQADKHKDSLERLSCHGTGC